MSLKATYSRRTGPKRRKVMSPLNSICSVDLDSLEWSSWFTDTTGGAFYLHVKRGEEWHTVVCRETSKPRLEMVNNQLFWLVDG